MPIYLFWGEDEFALSQAVAKLKNKVLDPNWSQFNYDKLIGDRPETIIEGLNRTMTPAFGTGDRLVWLADTNICQQCSEDLLLELKRTLPVIAETSHLLFTSSKKPDGRLKSTKLIKEYALEQEFSLIAPWKIEALQDQVEQTARNIGVELTPQAVALLAESVGNNTRQLVNELEKLSLYYEKQNRPLEANIVATLVVCNTHNSLQLAGAIREGNSEKALGLVSDIINRNEPPLRIVATLVGQFRTWTIVKLMLEAGENNEKVIATAAEIGNPKRIYFLRQEITALSSQQLLATLPVLLDLEYRLKRGAEPLSTLQTKIIELCRLCQQQD
ncbi:DNA polymerase III subunit delta [Pleurocapsales cyanobacterium LEGE 06147]|nr:DNA polymerase III subunit delta [Pleurocapsales cyanobacterium LEGE 06147]